MLKILIATAAAALMLAGAGHAQDKYPIRNVALVLPFSPGGGTDTLARILAEKMSASMGEQVIVDNRPGAAGNIASDFVAKSDADGYTVLLGFSSALTINPNLYKNLAFDVQKDFAPVALIAEAQYFLVVRPTLDVNTLEEFIAYAKEHPGELNFSSSGIGGPLHLAAELLMSRTGTEMVHIPYQGGSEAVQSVLSGEVDFAFGSVSAINEYVQTGGLIALATSGLKRSDVLPDVPTLNESGLDGFNVTSWYSFLLPAGSPQVAIDTLFAEVKKALADETVKTQLANSGLTPVGADGAALAALIQDEMTTWAEVIKRAGIDPLQ